MRGDMGMLDQPGLFHFIPPRPYQNMYMNIHHISVGTVPAPIWLN